MSEQVWVAPLERTQPYPHRFRVASEPFVLANRPPHDEGINRAEFSGVSGKPRVVAGQRCLRWAYVHGWRVTPAGSSRGAWYLARAKALSVGLPNAYFKSLGLPSLVEAG
jgi:hypothetical protein